VLSPACCGIPAGCFPLARDGCAAATGGFPPAAGPVVEAGASATEGRPGRGPMALDITLAVGDGARRMTYAEFGECQRISLPRQGGLSYVTAGRARTGNDGVVK